MKKWHRGGKDGLIIYDDDGNPVANAETFTGANLIAAAPEMFEELKEIAKRMERIASILSDDVPLRSFGLQLPLHSLGLQKFLGTSSIYEIIGRLEKTGDSDGLHDRCDDREKVD